MESRKNMGLSWGVEIFRERERSEDEEISERPRAPPHHAMARPGLGRAPLWWGGMVGPPEVSQVPLCPIFGRNFFKKISRIFRETLFLRIFQKLTRD
jgi:hypothetical protein